MTQKILESRFLHICIIRTDWHACIVLVRLECMKYKYLPILDRENSLKIANDSTLGLRLFGLIDVHKALVYFKKGEI